MPTEQIAVRLPPALLEELDALVRTGVHESRAAAVRAGIEALVERARSRRIDEQVVAGYRAVPPSKAEDRAARAALRRSILEEPW